ncbi:NAD(P)-binding domain-containing protein [Streptomyces sp. B6B3]|uniref:NAD(P)-dependent oxidoreductase n=1 Tax=Streptomyces sp. B6B3 TaxID=3153570 RepID=UPI00325E6D1E
MNSAPESTPPRTPVSVIGLGNLGRALAAALVERGHPTTVWNRTAGRADDLVARGARRADTVGEALEAGELVIVCLLDQDAARAVLAQGAGALAGRAVVNITSGTPEPVRELADWAAGHGADYLAGAVYAVPQTIGTPEAFVLYSGSRAVFEAHRDTLDAVLGGGTFTGADPALASVHDMAVLSGMYGMFAGFFHGVALAGTEGISAADITRHMTRWLTEAAAALPGFAAEIDAGDYTTETSTLDINAWGLGAILTASRARGIGDALLAPLQELFRREVDAGHGAASLARTVESLPSHGRAPAWGHPRPKAGGR